MLRLKKKDGQDMESLFDKYKYDVYNYRRDKKAYPKPYSVHKSYETPTYYVYFHCFMIDGCTGEACIPYATINIYDKKTDAGVMSINFISCISDDRGHLSITVGQLGRYSISSSVYFEIPYTRYNKEDVDDDDLYQCPQCPHCKNHIDIHNVENTVLEHDTTHVLYEIHCDSCGTPLKYRENLRITGSIVNE